MILILFVIVYHCVLQPTTFPAPVATTSSTPLKSALTKSLPLASPSASTSNSTLPKPLFPLISPAVSWPKPLRIGSGLNNQGNTCFLNSALQVLLHTAPLVRFIVSSGHDGKNCTSRFKMVIDRIHFFQF